MNEHYYRRLLAGILAVYLLLSLGYGIVVPLFEAPDEDSHYFTVQVIADTSSLPRVGPEPDRWMGQEAAQPPLYYFLGTLVVNAIDTDGARDLIWRNPFVRRGDASSPTNINAFVHGLVEAWPWQGHVLAAHLLRALSALFGVSTLLCIFASGRLLWPSEPHLALLAAALTAFLPQFGFLHGAVSNDPLIILLSTAALWQLLRLWLDHVSWVRLLGLGITTGLAILTKSVGLLLLPFVVGVLFLLAVRDSDWRLLWETALLVAGAALLVSGWLLWRNCTLYGDITAATAFIGFFGGDRDYTVSQALAESTGIWPSLFAVFGWFNVRAPDWVYGAWHALTLLALTQAVWSSTAAWRRRPARSYRLRPRQLLQQPWMPAFLLGAWLLLVLVGLTSFMLQTPAAQGRLLFPALTPMALALAWSLGRYKWRGIRWLSVVLALATSLWSLLVVIPDAYAAPLTVAQPPSRAVLLNHDMGQNLTLVAADLETTETRAGDTVWLTLYWRARAVPDRAPQIVLVLFGRQRELVGKLQSYHGGGLYPANLWPVGETVADRIGVRLSRDILVPARVQLDLGLVGGAHTVNVGTLKVVPASWPAATEPILAQIGTDIDLAAATLSSHTVRPGGSVTLLVRWQVKSAPGMDMTTFVHVGDPSDPPLAQADGVPLSGDYPTYLWAAGEVISDTYTLRLPLEVAGGRYPVWIGLYDPSTLVRRPLSVKGVRQPHDAYRVGWLDVRG